jgi:hypothetical protein
MGAQTSEVISRFNKFDLANTAAPNSTTYGVMGGPMDRMTGGRDRNYIQWVPESGAGDQVKEEGLGKLPVFTPPAPGA